MKNYLKTKKHEFTQILKKYKYKLHSGDIVAGTILFQEFTGFLVNIGHKNNGYLPIEEINNQFIKTQKCKKLLSHITRDFFIIKYNSCKKQYILSIKRLEYIRSWQRIKQIAVENCIFDTKIKHINKGGLITQIEGIQAFIPKSHIYSNKGIEFIQNKNVKCKILAINDIKNQLILTAKSPLLKLSHHKLKIGEILYGLIIKIKTYGLFIKIYNIIALLHISEIGYTYIYDINDKFDINKIIKIKIIHIDKKQGRVSVSKKYIKK